MVNREKQVQFRLNRKQSRAIDTLASEKYRIPGIVLMENAARGAADVAEEILGERLNGAKIAILCGPGNNGGDGLAIARHLHNRGAAVHIFFLSDPARYKGDARINWNIAQAMRLPAAPLTADVVQNLTSDLLIDALFGTGLTRAPRPPFDQVAHATNQTRLPTLSVDLPSGLDCDTGQPLGATAIRASHTVTFVAEKVGFSNPAAQQYLGQITVADIGCPRECIDEAINNFDDATN